MAEGGSCPGDLPKREIRGPLVQVLPQRRVPGGDDSTGDLFRYTASGSPHIGPIGAPFDHLFFGVASDVPKICRVTPLGPNVELHGPFGQGPRYPGGETLVRQPTQLGSGQLKLRVQARDDVKARWLLAIVHELMGKISKGRYVRALRVTLDDHVHTNCIVEHLKYLIDIARDPAGAVGGHAMGDHAYEGAPEAQGLASLPNLESEPLWRPAAVLGLAHGLPLEDAR